MSFEHAEKLWLLILLIPLALVFILELRQTRAALHNLGGRWNGSEAQAVVGVKWFVSTLLFLLFFLFSVLSLAQPQWGEMPKEEDQRDMDVVFALDVSKSMLALDVQPSRMGRGTEIISALVQELPSPRVALVLFRGDGLTLVPMTEDAEALRSALVHVGPAVMSNAGTDIAGGLGRAVSAFPQGSNRHQVLVLLTDGEDFGAGYGAFPQILRDKGIRAVVVGLGTQSGAAVPDLGNTLLHDADGNVVVSRLNEAALKRFAEASNGVYLNSGESGLFSRLLEEVRGFSERQEREGFRLVPIERSAIFLVVALVCLGLYIALRSLRWRKIW